MANVETDILRDLSVTGRIFDIQRFSIHDGPGIRTTVFLKGCPLRCIWCHNPEGIAPEPMLSFQPDRCIGCGYCFRHCPNEAHSMADERHVLDRSRCRLCFQCTAECYAGALEQVGREITVGEALETVLRDQPFYETSGGGLTLSGGEPMMQLQFTEALLRAAKDRSLHCCIETCGACEFEALERVLPVVDLFLYDLKETDPARHEEYTGVGNERILKNLRRLHDRGAALILRLPIVPGLNDRDDHFRNVAALAKSLPRLLGVETMPYHRLGTAKADRLGWTGAGTQVFVPPEPNVVARWNQRLSALGVNVMNTQPPHA